MSSSGGDPQGFPTNTQPLTNIVNGLVTRPWHLFFLALWNRTGGASGGTVVPPGTVVDFAGTEANIPSGWLACGQAVLRNQYAALFSAIGVTWGAGDGSTTFDLPPQGIFSKGVTTDAVGATGGHTTVTLAVGNLPAHNHAITDPGHVHAITDPGHIHAITDPGHVHTSLVASSTNTAGAAAGTGTAGNTGSATTGVTINSHATGITINSQVTGITTQNTGTGTPLNTLPPYGTFLKIIKT